MVHTAVQKCPVVGHQQKSLLFAKILCNSLAASGVQVIGGLINQQIPGFPAKEGCQKALGLLAVGESCKRAVECFGLHAQKSAFPQ